PDPYMGYSRHLGWEILGDDQTPSERWRQWDWGVIPFILGEWTPSSSWNGNYWAYLPQRIREAMIFIQNVHPLPEQGISAQEVAYMQAECRFLAAYYWYLLANTYGPVPFKPDYIAPTDFDLAELMEGQRPYYEIIDWCEQEMAAVAKILPARYTEARKYGRVTSIMCLAVRARMLLFAASPLVNGNPDYAGHVNRDGEHLFSLTADPERWSKAAEACRELIVLAEEAGHTLYVEQNANGTIDPFASCQNLFLTRFDEGNKEILFARPGGCDYTEYEKHICPTAAGGSGGLGVTQSLVDAFFMRNGLPIDDPESGYVEEGFSVSDDRRGKDWEKDCNNCATTAAGTYNMYCNREPRFYTAVSYNGSYFWQEERPYEFFYGQQDNPHTHDAPQNGYLLRKKVSPDTNVKEGNFKYRPGILYRLGEAYLNYAEALNESAPGHNDILLYLNKIRERAGVRQYTAGATDNGHIHVDLADQETMRRLIRAERRVELCCEGIRYDDLRRWKEAETLLNGDFYGMNFSGRNEASFYVRTPYQTRVYKKSYYWFPIHQSEIDKNPKLIQNPYWN
ncbi:MAG: RagB/SusD family nutrient uptake outer membrane protein, partial [Alistipes sp.]|nr:RagB/SusD family nutrient uptake outer membrane protein [Alistipes sp.]